MVAPYPSPSAPAPAAAGGDPTAVFSRRILAFVVDGVVVAVPGFALASSRFETYDASDAGLSGSEFCDAYLGQNSGGACVNLDDTVYFDEGGVDPVSFAPLVFLLLVAVLLQGLTGFTIGKLVTGLRTVREDGSVPGIGRALLRWVLMVVDGQPCGLPLVGLITAGTSTGHRRVGDMAAKTYVVRSSAAGAPIVLPGSAPIPASGGAWGAPPAWSTTPPPPPGPGQPGGDTGWGAPTPPPERTEGGWAAPESSTPAAPESPAPAPTTPAPVGSEPQWDPARNTYIQWDPAQARWLQWDEGTRTWTVIPGQ